MPRLTSQQARIESRRTSGTEPFLEAIEISVPVIAGNVSRAIRLVNDSDDIVIGGETFTACPFSVSLPGDADGEMPSASIAIDAAHADIMKLIEATGGAQNSTARLMVLLRSTGTPEIEFSMELYGIKATPASITGQLGFADLMSRASLNQRYEQRTAAGLI